MEAIVVQKRTHFQRRAGLRQGGAYKSTNPAAELDAKSTFAFSSE
jgi:hypothetical protein